MNWLRWYHGTVTDPKWRVIAKASGRTIPEVIAIWAFALEHASQNEERGTLVGLDVESAAAALEVPEEAVTAVLSAMDGRVKRHETLTGWMKRQVKRERVSDHSTERVRRHRERTRTANDDNDLGDETPRNATKHPDKRRGDKRRSTSNPSREEVSRASALPPDWIPTDGHREMAFAEGVLLDREASRFRDWATSKGEKKRDWDAAFRNWLRKAGEFTRGGGNGRHGAPAPARTAQGRPAIAAGQGVYVVE